MSQGKTNFASSQDNTSFCPEQNLLDAISHINKHASSLSSTPLRQQDVSQYICDLLEELSTIASQANLIFLTYLIDVAHEEARLQAREHERPYL